MIRARAYLSDLLRLSETFGSFVSFAWDDWKQVGDRMVSPSGKRKLTLPVFQRLKAAAPDDKPAAKTKAAPAAAPPPAPKDQPTPPKPPAESLAAQIAGRLRAGQPFTSKELFALADTAYGRTRAQGGYGPSDAYDALEAGVNLALKGNTDPTADAAGAARQTQNILDDVLRQLPTQTNRSGNKDAFQQFSTPPHYSYVAAWLANLNPKDVVLEPSGGTGSLAVHAANSGASVVANELDPKRAALLKAVTGGAVYGENAEQISAILAGKVKPTAVVMNPPFSATAGRLAKKDLGTAGKHIDESLALLAPGGRLVAIVGEGMNDEPRKAGGRNRGATTVSPVYAKWFASLAERGYTLRANVGVAGKEYTKYGTGFGTRILIIDKEQPDGRPAVRGDVATVGELIPLLEGVRNDRPQPTGTTPGDATGRAAPTGAAAGGPSGRDAAGGLAAGGNTGGVGDRGVRGNRATAVAGGGVAAGGRLRATPGGAGNARGVAGSGRATVGAGTGSGDVGSGGLDTDGKPAVQSGDRVPRLTPPERLTPLAADASPAPPEPNFTGLAPNGVYFINGVAQKRKGDEPTIDDMTESLYEGYRPAVRFAGAKPHPGKLDESAAMSAIKPPPVTYAPTLSPDVIASGMPSEAALENVAYAGQSHQQFLEPDANGVMYRRGFFIGDGTGAGKGQQIAATIADNWNQGRKKHVWITEKSPLLEDARRDWAAVGMDGKQIIPFDKLKDGEKAPGEGITFVTYDTLKSKPKDPTAPTNLQRLAAWLGTDFEGVIAFDEAHNMGNAQQTDGPRGNKPASAKALAGVELQKMLPNARVVYVSATGATEVSNLAYADRLGLWGKGTAFADKNQFIGEMTQGGVAAMESVAQSLKAAGLYNARSLSLNDGTPDGAVMYDRVTHSLTADQIEQYDAAADGWQMVLQNIDAALEVTGGKDDRFARAAAKSQFWGAQQRFFNQLMTSMQTPSVINAVEKDIAEGRAPVVQLVNTMEAATGRAVDKAEDGDLEHIDVSPREILMGYIEKSFPVHRYEMRVGEDGKTMQSVIVKDSAGDPVEDPQAVAMRERLLDQLGGLRIPESPLDQIVNHFGPDQVAEATGRGQRLVYRTQPDGSTKRVLESRNPAIANVSEAAAFQGGKKKLLVFSDAGGTGRSYHADKTAANQKKRVHYMLQPGWRADKAVQGLGRTHRTNQASAPHYRLVEIEQLKAQKRFVSTIARRLDQLGALTRGQRQTGSGGLFSAADNLESQEAKQALDSLFTDIERNRVPGLPYRETMQQLGFATEDKEGRPKKVEPPPMSQFLNRLLSLRVEKQGKVFEEFDGRLQKVVEAAVANGTLDQGMENYRAERLVKRDEKVVYTDPKTGAETRLVSATAFKKTNRRPFDTNTRMPQLIGYFRDDKGRVRAAQDGWPDVTDTITGAVRKRVGLYGPAGLDRRQPSKMDLSYTPSKWTPVDEATARAEWQKEFDALPEFDETEEHFLTGSLLPVWDRIPKTDRPKIFRFKPEGDARASVGRHIPANQLETLSKNLNVQVNRRDLAPERVHAELEGGRKAARLVNGWRLKPVRVGNERRIEIVGPGYSDQNLLIADGVIRERVGYDTRLFIPTGPAGVEVLKRIVGLKPVAEVNDVSQFSEPAGVQGRRPFEAFGWDDWKQDAGGKWRSPGGRVLSDPVYQRMRGRKQHIPALAQSTADAGRMAAAGNSPSVLDRPAPPPATAPQPTATPPVMDANAMARQRQAARLAARAAQPPRLSPLESMMGMTADEREREILRRSAGGTPAEQATVRAAASVPAVPQVTAAVDAQKPQLDAQHGERASRIYRSVADVFGRIGTAMKEPRLLAPVVSSALGAGAGAAVGTLIGGPFGLGAGTSIGAGLGLMIGDKLGKSMSVARLKVAVRKALSQTVPAAAGTLAGAGTAAVTLPLAAAGASYAVSPVGVATQLVGIDMWDTVFKVASAPFRLADMVYRGLKRRIEPSAAKARLRGFAETTPADPVQTAKQVMTTAGIDTAGIADEKVALALAVAAAVEDSAGATSDQPQAVETFGWEDWKQVDGGKRWRSPGGRVLSDLVFQRVSKRGRGGKGGQSPPVAAQPPEAAPPTVAKQTQPTPTSTAQIRRNLLTRAAHAVGGAIKKADSAVGRAVGSVGTKGLAWKKKKAATLKAKATEGKLGAVMQWLTNTDVGQRTLRDLERRSERVEKTFQEMGARGYVLGKVGGVKRVLRDTYANFLKNRRRYGLLPAVAIETAVLGMTVVLPKVATAGAAIVAGAAGSSAGPAGAVAGGVAGAVLSQGLMGFVARKVFGKAGAAMTRAAAESAAAWVSRARAGESPARKRARERAVVRKKWAAGRAAIANRRAGTDIPPIPRTGFAEVVATTPPTIADVAREVADRLRAVGAEPPPVGELVGVLGGVFDALQSAGEPIQTAG